MLHTQQPIKITWVEELYCVLVITYFSKIKPALKAGFMSLSSFKFYLALRREAPASPNKPKPKIAIVEGSGTFAKEIVPVN